MPFIFKIEDISVREETSGARQKITHKPNLTGYRMHSGYDWIVFFLWKKKAEITATLMFLLYLFINYFVGVCHGAHMEVSRQHCGVVSPLLPFCGLQEQKWGHKAWEARALTLWAISPAQSSNFSDIGYFAPMLSNMCLKYKFWFVL